MDRNSLYFCHTVRPRQCNPTTTTIVVKPSDGYIVEFLTILYIFCTFAEFFYNLNVIYSNKSDYRIKGRCLIKYVNSVVQY